MSATAQAQCPAPDASEPNDSSATATPISTGLTSNLTLEGTLATHFVVLDDEQVSWINDTGVAVDVAIQLTYSIIDTSFTCSDESLDATVGPDPCIAAVDDACGSAVTLTAGLRSGLFVSDSDEDFYKISVPSTEQVVIDQTWTVDDAWPAIEIYSDSTCSVLLDSGAWGSGVNQVVYGNATGATVDFYVRVYLDDGDCETYNLNVTLQPDACILTPDDAFEDDDDCASAVPLGAGTHTGLFMRDADSDWCVVMIPAGQVLTIVQTYSPVVAMGIDCFNDNLSCVWPDMQVAFGGGLNTQVLPNTLGAPVTVYLKCYMENGDACSSYDLNASFTSDPCQQTGADDFLEESDDCAGATPVSLAGESWTGLFVSKNDSDCYSFSLPDGASVQVDTSFISNNGNIDTFLYDSASAVAFTCGDPGSYLAASAGFDDVESISWTNTTGSTETYYIKVEGWNDPSNASCGTYDFDVTYSGSAYAFPFCFGDNSSAACPCGNASVVGAGEGCISSIGVGAILNVTGSNSIAADDLSFTVTQARPNQTAMLVQGASEIASPFKDGILCMGNPTERVEPMFLDASGMASTSGSIVTDGNITTPGSTRYYQVWFRDPGGISPCGNGSNFSQGLRVFWWI